MIEQFVRTTSKYKVGDKVIVYPSLSNSKPVFRQDTIAEVTDSEVVTWSGLKFSHKQVSADGKLKISKWQKHHQTYINNPEQALMVRRSTGVFMIFSTSFLTLAVISKFTTLFLNNPF